MKSRKAAKPKSSRLSVRLNLSAPVVLQSKVQKLQLAIARRAHELFEARAREHGRALDDWLQAESELLCPVSVAMSQSKDFVTLRANVAEFSQSEIEVSVEPRRVIIVGKKIPSIEKTEAGMTEQGGLHPDQIMQVIDLDTEVVPDRAMVELQSGELIFELPVASNKLGSAP